jgi:hypothetical protein
MEMQPINWWDDSETAGESVRSMEELVVPGSIERQAAREDDLSTLAGAPQAPSGRGR